MNIFFWIPFYNDFNTRCMECKKLFLYFLYFSWIKESYVFFWLFNTQSKGLVGICLTVYKKALFCLKYCNNHLYVVKSSRNVNYIPYQLKYKVLWPGKNITDRNLEVSYRWVFKSQLRNSLTDEKDGNVSKSPREI